MFSLLNKSLSDSKLREKERAAVSHKYPLNLLATSHQDAALSMDIHTVLYVIFFCIYECMYICMYVCVNVIVSLRCWQLRDLFVIQSNR